MCVKLILLVAVAYPVRARMRSQNFTGHQGPAAANLMGMRDRRKNAPPHMCYCTEFGRSRSNRMDMGPKTLGTRGIPALKLGRCLSVCPLLIQFCFLRQWLPLRFNFDCCSTAIRPRDFHSTTYVTNVRSSVYAGAKFGMVIYVWHLSTGHRVRYDHYPTEMELQHPHILRHLTYAPTQQNMHDDQPG